jgi:hypothetical protein
MLQVFGWCIVDNRRGIGVAQCANATKAALARMAWGSFMPYDSLPVLLGALRQALSYRPARFRAP